MQFKQLIKALIWRSDIVGGILPKDTHKISNEDDKDYLWIAREVEHGLLMRKKIVYLIERGCNLDTVRRDLANEDMGFLEPLSRTERPRTKKIIESLDDFTRLEFDVGSMDQTADSFSEQLREAIIGDINDALDHRRKAVVWGLMNQFSPSTVKFITAVHQFKRPLSKKELLFELKIKESSFYSAYRQIRSRQLELNGQPIPLVKLSGQGTKSKYIGNLPVICRILYPRYAENQLSDWVKEVLKGAEGDPKIPF